MSSNNFRLRRPDDWHLHLRDGAMLAAVLPFTSAVFARAIIMPNLVPPLTTMAAIRDYRSRIVAAVPKAHRFEPLMTCYLTDAIDLNEIRAGHDEGLLTAAKLYPAGATTNSDSGVTAVEKIYPVLELMQRLDLPLLVHGEVVDNDVDIFDREALFVDRVLEPTRRQFPDLRIVLEHVTSKAAVDYVLSATNNLAATITPHHLLINRNALFSGGLRPHLYCLPIAKRERDRLALRAAATSGDPRFFLGTDSAPHTANTKECDGGCAGVFNAPTAMASLAQVFEDEDALDRLETFASLNGPKFYRLAPNEDTIEMSKVEPPVTSEDPEEIVVGDQRVRGFRPATGLHWRVGAIT